MKKYKNIVFIGGIHGAGKGRLCAEISQKLDVIHLSASDLLQWSDLNEDNTNKNVEDIRNTQERLVKGLQNIIKSNKRYIIDGHFCLLDKNGEIQTVPQDTFEHILPIAILVLEETPEVISTRLLARDNKCYSPSFLTKMQEKEIETAHEIAKHLGIDILTINSQNVDCATSFVAKQFNTSC